MAAQRDYYQVLGVAETATTDEIKKAFRRLAKQHHPDRNPNNPQAAERFKEINEAHDVLSDTEKRKKYDQLRRYGAFSGGFGGGGSSPRRGGAGTRGAPPDGGEFDISDLGGLGDLFSSIFCRRGQGRDDRYLPGVQRPRHRFIWSGRIRRQSSLSGVSGEGHRAVAALSDMPGKRRAARREAHQRRRPGGRGRRRA